MANKPMRILDYAHIPKPRKDAAGGAAQFLFVLCAAVVHVIGSVSLSKWFFALSGGSRVSGGWTAYGGTPCAWTPLAWLPGGLMSAVAERSPRYTAPLELVTLLIYAVASVFAGYLLATATATAFNRFAPRGRFHWRVWAFALAWLVWIPVPIELTFTYWMKNSI